MQISQVICLSESDKKKVNDFTENIVSTSQISFSAKALLKMCFKNQYMLCLYTGVNITQSNCLTHHASISGASENQHVFNHHQSENKLHSKPTHFVQVTCHLLCSYFDDQCAQVILK